MSDDREPAWVILNHFNKNRLPATVHFVPLTSFANFAPGGETEDSSSAARGAAPAALWFIIRGSDLLVSRSGESFDLPRAADISPLGFGAERSHLMGRLDGTPCRVVAAPLKAEAPAGWTFESVRGLFSAFPDGFFGAAARALGIAGWDREHRFCGVCGSPTALKRGERALECTACGHLAYPRISPAVIMAVVRDRQILLARARRFATGMYSVLAGFVEPGETLEDCVAREVREETGVEVKNLRYFASQPWPFPHSLMLAFTAEWAGGEIRPDPTEIADAGWFSADNFPKLPDPLSVARRLINWFAAGPGRTS